MTKQRWWFAVLVGFFLVILASCGNATGTNGQSGSQDVDVSLSEFTIGSSLTTFLPGKPYHFVITNNGQTVHEFLIMPK